jgi:curved DNA-binding protein CbpA
MQLDARDPYTVLGLERSAQAADIKARYYDLVKVCPAGCRSVVASHRLGPQEHHPDKGGADTPEGKEAFSLIMDAYALLRNPTARAAYLQSGIGWEHGSGGPSSTSRASTTTTGSDQAGFHTGRRRAFNERHRPATSQEEYARQRADRRRDERERLYAWDRGQPQMKPGRTMDGTWTQYDNMKEYVPAPLASRRC